MEKAVPVRQDLVQALLSILAEGIQEHMLDDSEALLSCIKILNPGLSCINEFESYIAIKRGFIREALQIYLAAPADTTKWFVMTALCLKLSADPTWYSHATRCLEMDDDFAKHSHPLARVLLGIAPQAEEAAGEKSATAPATAATLDFSQPYGNFLSV